MTEYATSPPAPDAASEPLSRGPLIAALAGLAAWFLVLAALAVLRANPITVNLRQVRDADLIVTGRVDPANAELLIVTREEKSNVDLTQVRVRNLRKTAVRPGSEWVVPLTRVQADLYEVTPTLRKNGPLLVYPAVPETYDQLRAALSDERAEPQPRDGFGKN